MNTNTTTSVDLDGLARRMAEVMVDMLHKENFHGTDQVRYAEGLRRALAYHPAGDGSGGRALPYDSLGRGFGLTTQAEADHTRESHTIVDRLAREAAEKKVAEMRAEVARVYREARGDVADYLRSRCNERSVPSKYRREGVAWAADMLDPSVPKDLHGNLIESDGGEHRDR